MFHQFSQRMMTFHQYFKDECEYNPSISFNLIFNTYTVKMIYEVGIV